jgi:hypothetical protein
MSNRHVTQEAPWVAEQHPFLDPELPGPLVDLEPDWDQFDYEWSCLNSLSGNSESTSMTNPDWILSMTPMEDVLDPWSSMRDNTYYSEDRTLYQDMEASMSMSSETSDSSLALPSSNRKSSDHAPAPSSVQAESSALSPSTASQRSPEPYPTTQYTCSFCAKSFNKQKTLKFVPLIPIPTSSVLTIQMLTSIPKSRHKKQHIKPVQCPHPQCTYRTAENRDLDRHISVRHRHHTLPQLSVSSRFACQEPGCRSRGLSFGRKDNLQRHMTRAHSRLIP